MPYHKKRKTDRPPRELIPKDSMKAAGAAVLDGKPVHAVARESSVTHMTLEQYVRKSELLQTPYVDQFMPQLKFSRENAVRLSFTRDKASLRLFLENNPAIQNNMSKLILTAYVYINVANKGTNVKTGHQPSCVTLS